MRYLATLLGSTGEQTTRWFILVVAMLLDPAAIPLLPARRAPIDPNQVRFRKAR